MASCACTARSVGTQRSLSASSGRQLARPQPWSRTSQIRSAKRQQHLVRAESSRGGGFASGFLVGGALFGTLGFLFAPQISRAILGQDQKLRLPKFLEEEEKSPEATKQDLADKIAQLNSAIDDVSSQLKASDAVEEASQVHVVRCMSKRVRSPSNNKLVAAGLLGFIGLSASFPFVFARTGPTVDSSKPLSGQAAVRGAYINSGSKDIGPDPTRYDGSKVFDASKSTAPGSGRRALRKHCCAEQQSNACSASHKPECCWFHQIAQQSQQAAAACLAALQLSMLPLAGEFASPPPSSALLTSPNAQIPRSVDAALRRSIPAFNRDVKDVQNRMEDVSFKLRIPQRKPWQGMAENVQASLVLAQQPDKMMYGVPEERKQEAQRYLKAVQDGLKKVQGAIDLKDSDRTSIRTTDVLRNVAELEVIQAPNLSFIPPKSYSNLPQLKGRGVVELTIEKSDGSSAFVVNEGGGPQPQAHLTMVLEGYSAPVTAGNFATNVLQKLYVGKTLTVDYTGVLVGKGSVSGKQIPLEIMPLGDFEPIYGSPLNVQAGELPVLPMSIYGSVAMAHASDADEGFAAADEFFIYKYDRASSGLAGLSFDEGTFGVFAYIAKGAELIPQLTSGDVIVSAELVSGHNKLTKLPGSAA
ncbi:hypothetical protein WJX82_011108 [Trebouxia sp. C0006]